MVGRVVGRVRYDYIVCLKETGKEIGRLGTRSCLRHWRLEWPPAAVASGDRVVRGRGWGAAGSTNIAA